MPQLLLKIKNLKKPITLMQFNLILAIWLGVVLNYDFFEKINKLTSYHQTLMFSKLSPT
jgi:lipid A ethanolaminephosphotransferase